MTKWGIIGLGRIARKFADDLKLVPGAKLSAVASTSLERAEAFAKDYDVPHFYGSYEEIARCPELDVVYIATPHVQHCENTIFCLENGLPVLVEKPFAMNSGEAKRMVEAARRNRVFLMEALWTRFIPAVDHAFSLIKKGEIGEIHTVSADFGFHAPFDPEWRIFNKSLGGGSLLDVGIYPVLLSNFLFGKPKRRDVFATANFTDGGVDESCAMTFKFPGKKLSLLHSTILSNTGMDARIFGKTGTITLHRRFHHAKKLTVSQFDDANRTENFREIEMPYEGWGYSFEAAHVMECLRKGRLESQKVPLKFSFGLTETLDLVRSKIRLNY